jgi:mono/diheme cytochrome c family protein
MKAWFLIAAAATAVAAVSATAQTAEPTFTADQATQGTELYKANCAQCHGENLNDGQFAPALKGSAFHDNWGGHNVGELYTRISTTMPPDQVGVLKPEEYAAVIATILQANGAAAGADPLPAENAKLEAMTIAK